MRCAHCGSTEVQSGLDKYNCLTCGESTTAQGRQVPPLQRTLNDDEYQAHLNREHDELKAAYTDLEAKYNALKEQHGEPIS